MGYSDVQGGWPGTGNIAADPQFGEYPDPNSVFYAEYYLDPNSPCIDGGSETTADMGLLGYTTRTDLAPDANDVDMGYHYPRDCNGNGVPDPLDILNCPPDDPNCADCNYNGVPDGCDIATGTSQDTNNDAVPDECQGRPDPGYFTSKPDFDLGTLINVQDQPDQSQLLRCDIARPLPYLWVPASNRGTAVRIYTGSDPAIGSTGAVLGEYLSAPDHTSSSPSRTAVDLDGRVWVANREDNDPNGTGSVVRIGLVIGGKRCDVTGTPTPFGQYLKPPFKYNTCIDRDGDGLIRTSRGLGDCLAWPGQYGSVSTADDECICNYVRVLGMGTRHVSVDRDNNVWVGGYESGVFEVLDGATGASLATFTTYWNAGYGGLIDRHFVLWSAKRLIRRDTQGTIDPNDDITTQPAGEEERSYGLAIDRDGNVWASRGDPNQNIMKYLPSGDRAPGFEQGGKPTGGAEYDRGVAVTLADNNVWVANSGNWSGYEVSRLDPSGDPVAMVKLADPNDPNDPNDPQNGYGPSALAVDQDGYLWVPCKESSTVKRIRPDTNRVDLTVDLSTPALEAQPYAYSDMTGQVTLHTAVNGTWNVLRDGGHFHADWHLLLWNRQCMSPPGALHVEVRAADFQAVLTSRAYQTVHDGQRFDDVNGRFLEIRVRFPGPYTLPGFVSPALCDLRATHGLGDMNCDGVVNFADINGFNLALSDPEAYAAAYPRCDWLLADCSGDGRVSFADINCFVALLGGE